MVNRSKMLLAISFNLLLVHQHTAHHVGVNIALILDGTRSQINDATYKQAKVVFKAKDSSVFFLPTEDIVARTDNSIIQIFLDLRRDMTCFVFRLLIFLLSFFSFYICYCYFSFFFLLI